jgi:hypothetical protein
MPTPHQHQERGRWSSSAPTPTARSWRPCGGIPVPGRTASWAGPREHGPPVGYLSPAADAAQVPGGEPRVGGRRGAGRTGPSRVGSLRAPPPGWPQPPAGDRAAGQLGDQPGRLVAHRLGGPVEDTSIGGPSLRGLVAAPLTTMAVANACADAARPAHAVLVGRARSVSPGRTSTVWTARIVDEASGHRLSVSTDTRDCGSAARTLRQRSRWTAGSGTVRGSPASDTGQNQIIAVCGRRGRRPRPQPASATPRRYFEGFIGRLSRSGGAGPRRCGCRPCRRRRRRRRRRGGR